MAFPVSPKIANGYGQTKSCKYVHMIGLYRFMGVVFMTFFDPTHHKCDKLQIGQGNGQNRKWKHVSHIKYFEAIILEPNMTPWRVRFNLP